MAVKSYSDEEIFDWAEQVLLGEKTWSDLHFLGEDDIARVKARVRRGLRSLAESAPRHSSMLERMKRRRQASQQPGKSKFIAEHKPKDEDLVGMAARLGVALFPFKHIMAEDVAVLRRIVEAWVRHLSPEELALLFSRLIDGEEEAVGKAISPQLLEEIQFHQEKMTEDSHPDEIVEPIIAKYSIISLRSLQEMDDISSELSEFLKEYEEGFQEDLQGYLRSLPERLGLDEIMNRFTVRHWNILSGLTPRDDMALLGDFLSEELFRCLVGPLPSGQQDLLNEAMESHKQRKVDPYSAFNESLACLKRFRALLGKVRRMDLDDQG